MRSAGAQLVALLVISLLAYGLSLQNGYVYLDDTNYLVFNPLVTDFSLARIPELFGSVRGNFTPLTWLTHILGWMISGEAPFAHHLLSVLLHLINVCLVYFLGRALLASALLHRLSYGQSDISDWAPFFIALLFAVHPQNVEAVAWIAARKDLLMCSFAIVTTLFWLRNRQKPAELNYIAALVTFSLACLGKPTAVMLIPVLLVLDLVPMRQQTAGVALKSALFRSIPFVAIALVIGVLAYNAQVAANAINPDSGFTLLERACIVLKNYCSYFVRYFLPLDYAVNYPLNKDLSWQVLLGFGGLLTVLAGLGRRSTRPSALVWLCTAILLLPSVGVIQYGVQATGDRFTYLAFIPMHVWLVCIICAGLRQIAERRVLRLAQGAIGLAFLLMFQVTVAQTRVWRDDMSLWAHGVAVQPDNALAYQYLGDAFLRRGDYPLAIRSFDESATLAAAGVYMDTRSLYFSQGRAHYELGDYATAYDWFDRLLEDDPQSFDRIGYAYYFVADILARRGQLESAANYAGESLKYIPDYALAVQLNAALQERLAQ